MAAKKYATQQNLQALISELKTRVVHPEAGKGLSSNDLTAELLAKITAAQTAQQVEAAIAQGVDLTGYVREEDLQELTSADIAALFADWN